MKILFLITPAHGHVNPTLPVAQELVQRGEEVVYYLTDEFKARVERTGAAFRRLDDIFNVPGLNKVQASLEAGHVVSLKDFLGVLVQYATNTLLKVPELLEQIRAEDFDCAVYDPVSQWGRALVKTLGVPAVTSYPTFVMTKNSPAARQMLSSLNGLPPLNVIVAMLRLLWINWKLHIRYGLPMLRPMDMASEESLNIVFLPRQFYPNADVLDERYVFVGPSILPSTVDYQADLPLKELEDRPTLYISLGTVWNTRTEFFKACLDAFANTRWLVVMATWNELDLGELPPNFIVRPRVPQLEVLQRADVFITHGGTNSAMGGLWYGVPMIVVPQIPDEVLVGDLVTEFGFGIKLDSTPSATALRNAVESIDTDTTYRTRLADMQTAMRDAGGYRRAADEIQRWMYRTVQIPYVRQHFSTELETI